MGRYRYSTFAFFYQAMIVNRNRDIKILIVLLWLFLIAKGYM
jgi:hypothetical protein